MIIAIASFKGGVGKTTTAIHLAAYFQTLAPTLLVDGDIVRASTKWAARGSLPFKVAPIGQIARHVKDYTHIIIDTEANPSDDGFKEAAEGCDLLVIPAELETTAKDGLIYTLARLEAIGHRHHRVLLTKVPPPPQTEGQQLRAGLANSVPAFEAEIPLLVAFKKASAAGATVDQLKSDRNARRAWIAYRSVGQEITHGRRQGKIWEPPIRNPAGARSAAPPPCSFLRGGPCSPASAVHPAESKRAYCSRRRVSAARKSPAPPGRQDGLLRSCAGIAGRGACHPE
jgi:chromosome partitioning protein